MPVEVCEESEICGPKSDIVCEKVEEVKCGEVEVEVCRPKQLCRTLYRNVCNDEGVCDQQLEDVCSETDEGE